ncbi:MAG: putative arabinose efflux permease, family [Hyphomicrobiales bacterium]|nr:putative arabinose efflux permease, family [Hyphomicrobiales bacterium]
MATASPKPPILRCLSHRNYALFEGGLLPNYMSGWMQRVGAGWLAWELSGSPVWLGVIAAADLAPMLVLAPIAGAWTDRVNPLPLIRVAQAGLLLQAVLMSALTLAGAMTIEILFGLTVFAGIIFPFHSTARQSLIPACVPREDFASAIALDSASFHSNRFIGPAIAAFVIPVWGVAGAFLAHVLGSGVCLVSLLLLRLPPPDRGDAKSRALFADVAEGMTYAARHAGLRPILLMLVFASLSVRPLQDMLPGFAGAVFNAGPTGLAWLTSSIGAGAMCGAVYIAARGALSGLTRVSMWGYFGTAATALGFVSTQNLWVGVLFAVLTGFSINVMSTSIQALMQFSVEDRMRGRIMALYLLIFRGMPALGALAIGYLADSIGLQGAFAIAAGTCLVFLLVVLPREGQIARALESPPGRKPGP